jgi:hypothetical protein
MNVFSTVVSVAAVIAAAAAAAPNTTLVSFDGAPGTTYKFIVTNDPVMGGLSSSNFTQDTSAGKAVFQGTVRIVPSLQAPGFCQALSSLLAKYADLSAYTHLGLVVRTSTPFNGFKVSFAADTLNTLFASFKADFTLKPSTDWQLVTIPFTSFSNAWSPATGEPLRTCAEDPTVCVTPKNLRDIAQVGLWLEGGPVCVSCWADVCLRACARARRVACV